MIKGKEIIGRNIVALSTGEKVETVHDVVFDHQANRVLALLVEEGGWFRSAKAIPFERIRSIGEHAVMIGSPEDVTTSRDDARLADALESKTTLIGMTLLTTDGQNLGRIADVYFDEHSGAVVGYEATGGLFADMSSGRAFVPAPSDVQIGADAAIVPLAVAAAMKENPGGIRGAIKSVGDAVSGTVQNASDSVKGAVDTAREAVNDRQQEYVVGKTSNTDLVAEDGTVIIKKGETITPLHAEVAERHGKLPALSAAATGGVVTGAAAQASEVVRGAYEDAASAAKERQKDFVIGKTAGADIVLDNGMPIVHKGDVITQAQADAAEKAGKLTALSAAATGGSLADALDSAKARVQDSYDDVKDAAADRQKAYVIGKIAGHNVVSDSGEVIVAKGITISAHHANRAEQTGQLAALTAAATAGTVVTAVTPAADTAPHSTPLTVQDTLGNRVKHDVRAPGGSLLAVQGQIVTTDLVARAENLGMQQELIDATVGQPSDHAGDKVAEVTAGASAAVASVAEGATNLLNKAKSWLHDKREETEAALNSRDQADREQRVRDALGRPVTRVILAPDDSIILNIGEIVTNKAISAAQQGNVLDILLDSVSKDAPTIDPLAVRPDETGRAALDSQHVVVPDETKPS